MHKSILFFFADLSVVEKVFSWILRLAITGTNPPSLSFILIMRVQSGPHLLDSGEARPYAPNIITEFISGQWWGFSVIWIPFNFVLSLVEAYLLRYKSALHHYNHRWWHAFPLTYDRKTCPTNHSHEWRSGPVHICFLICTSFRFKPTDSSSHCALT